MSDKDFAHIEANSMKQDDTLASNKKSIFITLASTVFAIVCFSVGFYMGEQHGLETVKGNKHQELVTKLQTQKNELIKLKEEAKQRQESANTSQVGDLTFFNDLPKQSTMPTPIDEEIKPKQSFIDTLAEKAAKKHDAAKAYKAAEAQATEQTIDDMIKTQMEHSSRTFRIQIASFKEKEDAQRFIPILREKGVIAEVKRVELAGLGTYYRVYSQSFDQEKKAMQVKQHIKDKLKITGILIQND